MKNNEENLVLTEAMAKELYENAPESMKRVFETTFKNTFNVKITDRIKNFDDVLDIYLKTHKLSEIGHILLNYSGNDKETLKDQAHKKLTIITEVLNQTWALNWEKNNQRKWYPLFKMAPFAFVEAVCEVWPSHSYCGSHLCFKIEELAIFAGKTFTDIYKIALSK